MTFTASKTQHKTINDTANSAKKANDGISNLFNLAISAIGNDTSRGNASTIYNIAKFLA